MTDARIEAAARAMFDRTKAEVLTAKWFTLSCTYDEVAEKDKDYWRDLVCPILAAADAAAWNTDIKKAPGFRQTIVVHLKNGDTTLANNEFPQGEDGWVDMMGDNIAEADIEAWMLIPRFPAPRNEAKS